MALVGQVLNLAGFVKILFSCNPAFVANAQLDVCSFLSSNVSKCTVLLAAHPPQLTQVLEHYLSCKGTSDCGTAACVLVNKDHQSFASEWLPLLRNMQELPCDLPGYAFWHDFHEHLPAQKK